MLLFIVDAIVGVIVGDIVGAIVYCWCSLLVLLLVLLLATLGISQVTENQIEFVFVTKGQSAVVL